MSFTVPVGDNAIDRARAEGFAAGYGTALSNDRGAPQVAAQADA